MYPKVQYYISYLVQFPLRSATKLSLLHSYADDIIMTILSFRQFNSNFTEW